MNDADWNDRIDRWMTDHAIDLERTYCELHELAEIGWQEHRTTAYLTRRLGELGLAVRTFAEHTGAIGAWTGTGSGRRIALRADIDALWQQVNGQWRANHSCGHDAHMTMVLFAVRCLKEIGYQVQEGELLAVFQPAEETAEGALAVLRSGQLDEVECILGIHLRPQQELTDGYASSAIYHGGVANVQGRISGRPAHAARPEDGINAIEVLAAIVTAVQAIPGDREAGSSCKVTVARVPNESDNLIPHEAAFTVDIRARSKGELVRLAERVRQTAAEIGAATGAEVETDWRIKAAPATPNAELERLVGEVIVQVLGEDGLAAPVVTPGAEDFHFYAMERETLGSTMIGLGCGLTPGLHHPEMVFNHNAMRTGAAILAVSAIQLMERGLHE